MMKHLLVALLVVPCVQAGSIKTEEDKNRECIAKFLQDAVKAIEYTAHDVKNEEEQRAVLTTLTDRITRLEKNQDVGSSVTVVAALAGVLGGALGSYLMNSYTNVGGHILGR